MPFIRRYPLIAYFLLAFLITWLFWIPMVLSSRDIIFGAIPREAWWAVGVIGPICAALIVASQTEGRQGVRSLLSRLLLWRAPLPAYAVALFSRAAVMLGALAVAAAGGAALPAIQFRPGAWAAAALLYVGGAICEETGWRGFALPRLQARVSPLVASVALGIIWAAWHLPQFYTLGDEHASRSFTLFLVNMVAFTILFTWVANRSGGSIFMAVLFHALGVNLVLDVIPFNPYHPVAIALAWVLALAAVALDPAMLRVGAPPATRQPARSA